MAARGVNKPVSVVKRTNYPARMAGRTAEVKPVGAWVQPEPLQVHNYYEAVHSAQVEESRIHSEFEEKQARLKQFQEDVKKRVAELARIKRSQELEKSYRAVEDERNIVRQTFHAAERLTPRKNRCYVRDNDSLAIKQTAQANVSRDVRFDSRSRETKEFEKQKQQLQKLNQAARRNLMSRRVITENYMKDDLPGGVWKQGATRDNPVEHPVSRRSRDGRVINVECDSDIDTVIIRGDTVTEIPSDNTLAKTVHFSEGSETSEDVREYVIHRKSVTEIPSDNTLAKTVHFSEGSETSEDVREYVIHRKSDSYDEQLYTTDGLTDGSPDSSPLSGFKKDILSVPVARPGVLDEEEKQRVVKQRALYRRLFMDIEREQVKESLRRKEHRKKINQLKKTKEEERRAAEREIKRAAEPVDPFTGETPEETLVREQEASERARQELEISSLRLQRVRESERFIEALRQNLREKLELNGIDLPALCACGTSLWETNPQTCANNCVFYHNPKAYAKALQSLLSSCDVA